MNIEEQFDEMLDESYGTITIAGIEFDASTILKRCDPIAHRVYLSDFASEMEEEED